MFGNAVASPIASSDAPNLFEATKTLTDTTVNVMTSTTKLSTVTRKMKLLISLVARPEHALLLVLMAHVGSLLAQTPEQQAWEILRAGVNERSNGKVSSPNRNEQQADSQTAMVWTNDDLEKLHSLGLISVVGPIDKEKPTPAPAPEPYVRTQDPEWYAAQAAKLRDELKRRQTQLSKYRQAIEDARSLRKTTGGINLDEGDLALTPEEGIEILERHVEEVQKEINELEDLARRNDIPPGTLRGQ